MRAAADYESVNLSTGERATSSEMARESLKKYEIMKAAKRAVQHIVDKEELGLHPTSEIFNFRMD